MIHIINKSNHYHQAKKGFLEDGSFSCNELKDTILGLVIFYLRSMKEDQLFPKIDIKSLKNQKNYYITLKEIKKNHYKKISIKDKKTFMMIFLELELSEKCNQSIQKI